VFAKARERIMAISSALQKILMIDACNVKLGNLLNKTLKPID